MSLGERIKQARKFLGYTQNDLANLTGMSRISIGNYERDSRVPDGNALKKIAIALNTSTDYLLGKKETSENPTQLDYAAGTIYFNYTQNKNEDFQLQQYLDSRGYKITPSIFLFTEEEVGTPKYTQYLNDWKNPDKQYYVLSKEKETFSVPPQAISELQDNIYRAIEFEWFRIRDKYKDFQPPATE